MNGAFEKFNHHIQELSAGKIQPPKKPRSLFSYNVYQGLVLGIVIRKRAIPAKLIYTTIFIEKTG
jgi:hypothetical protein